MSLLQVGDVIMGQYVDLSPRYYKIIKVTPQKVKVLRLKVTAETKLDIKPLPSTITYGDEITMTKKGDYEATHYGMVCSKYQS